MRRTSLVLLTVAVLAVLAGTPAAEASKGTVPIELRNGNGRAVVTSTRGSINVVVGLGKIRLVKRKGVRTSKFECANHVQQRRVSSVAIEFKGRRVSCLIWGPWRRQVIISGRRINASARVVGSLTLDAFDSGRTGSYSIRDRPFRSWPRRARTFSLAS